MSPTASKFDLLVAAAVLLCSAAAKAGQCDDPQGRCASEPCPAELSCYIDAECPLGLICAPCCLPGSCFCCDGVWCPEGQWSCSLDCAGKCVEPPERTGPPTYKIIDLGTLGGPTANAHGVNLLGQVVGEADLRTGYRHAFLWNGGTMFDLGVAAVNDRWSSARDINDSEHIALGSGVVSSTHRAYLLRDGQWVPLVGFGAGDTVAYAINNSDVVAGRSELPFVGNRAVIWEDGVITDLTAQGFEGGSALDINSAGAVVGGPTVWFQDAALDLSPLEPNQYSAARINDCFQVIGSALLYPGDPIGYYFLWTHGTVLDFGSIIGEDFWARALNNHAEVVGQRYRSCPADAFIYDEKHGARNLLSLVEKGTEWRELWPNGMNDLGQIVGYGTLEGRLRAFLMTPIFADFDRDGDTGAGDLASFVGCLGSPGQAIPMECVVGDVDRDGDVDLFDFWVIQRIMTKS